jgi:hypothetical protein
MEGAQLSATSSEQIRVLAADAKAQLTAARKPEEVKEVLTRISSAIFGNEVAPFANSILPAWSSDARRIFYDEQYANWAHFLLQFVLPNWVLCFTREERVHIFDAFFISSDVPQLDAFLALAQALVELARVDVPSTSIRNDEAKAKNSVADVLHRPQPIVHTEDGEGQQGATKDEKDFIGKTVAELFAAMVSTGGGLSRLFGHFARQGCVACRRHLHALTRARTRTHHGTPHSFLALLFSSCSTHAMGGQDNLWVRVLGLVCSLPDRISAVYRESTDAVPHALREQYATIHSPLSFLPRSCLLIHNPPGSTPSSSPRRH